MANNREAGYRRPPKTTQFKKGASGNPKGRPRGSLNFATILDRAAGEKVTINEGGRRRKISKLEAASIQIVNKAASGDLSAAKLLIDLIRTLPTANDESESKPYRNEHDLAVMKRLVQRMQRASGVLDGES